MDFKIPIIDEEPDSCETGIVGYVPEWFKIKKGLKYSSSVENSIFSGCPSLKDIGSYFLQIQTIDNKGLISEAKKISMEVRDLPLPEFYTWPVPYFFEGQEYCYEPYAIAIKPNGDNKQVIPAKISIVKAPEWLKLSSGKLIGVPDADYTPDIVNEFEINLEASYTLNGYTRKTLQIFRIKAKTACRCARGLDDWYYNHPCGYSNRIITYIGEKFEYNIGRTDSLKIETNPKWLNAINSDNYITDSILTGTPSDKNIGYHLLNFYKTDIYHSSYINLVVEVMDLPKPKFLSKPVLHSNYGNIYYYKPKVSVVLESTSTNKEIDAEIVATSIKSDDIDVSWLNFKDGILYGVVPELINSNKAIVNVELTAKYSIFGYLRESKQTFSLNINNISNASISNDYIYTSTTAPNQTTTFNLRPGVYKLKVSKAGYTTNIQEIDLFNDKNLKFDFSNYDNCPLSIIVKDNLGNAVSGAEYTIKLAENPKYSVNGYTSKNGEIIEYLPSGTKYLELTKDNISIMSTIENSHCDELLYILDNKEFSDYTKVMFEIRSNGTKLKNTTVNFNNMIDSTDYKGVSSFFVNMGTYNYSIKKEGFVTSESSLIIGINDTIAKIALDKQKPEAINTFDEKFYVTQNSSSIIINSISNIYIELINSSGQILFSAEITENKLVIPAKKLLQGMYIIKAQNNNKVICKKLMLIQN